MPDNSYVAAKRFGPVAASTTAVALAQQLAGAARNMVLTGTAVNDGSNMVTTVTLTSTANFSGVNFTITGTDESGAVITETRAGPNNNTVTTTDAFLTVTSIVTNAALGTNTSAGFTATTGTTGIVFSGRTRVRGMHGISKATAGIANFRNTSQTGSIILALDSSGAVDYLDPYIPDNGTLFKAGCFLDIGAGFTAITVFYDGPNPIGN